MTWKLLIGSGDRIGLFVLPALVVGVLLNVLYPSVFDVGGPPEALAIVCAVVLIPGLGVWGWSVVLILTRVPRNELITSGPYAVVKHPLYTGVAILVIPWAGFLFNTWLGVVIGAAVYAGSRIFSPAEERLLSEKHGAAWDRYLERVKIRWL